MALAGFPGNKVGERPEEGGQEKKNFLQCRRVRNHTLVDGRPSSTVVPPFKPAKRPLQLGWAQRTPSGYFP
jgi:hypothetical protein